MLPLKNQAEPTHEQAQVSMPSDGRDEACCSLADSAQSQANTQRQSDIRDYRYIKEPGQDQQIHQAQTADPQNKWWLF